jgi:hypothetical protein
MIAPSQGPRKEPDAPPTLRLARRLVASRLLPVRTQLAERARRAGTWKFWLLTAILAAILAVGCTHWLGIW